MNSNWSYSPEAPIRVGQSREIMFEFGSTVATALAAPKRIRPPSWPRVAVASSIQNTKLFTWRTWPGASAVPKCDQRSATSCEPITQSTFMEPPTMLLVPICRDMQLWWDKPLIPSPRNRMPGDTCFDDVGRNCACVTWTQMYVTLQTKNVFHSKAVIILFFNPPLCYFFSVTHFNIEEIL